MAAPNLREFNKLEAGNADVKLGNTNMTLLINNPAASGKTIRVLNVFAANAHATDACDVTLARHSEAALGGTATKIAPAVSIPIKSSLVGITKDEIIYLLENQSLGVQASAADALEITANYEEIS